MICIECGNFIENTYKEFSKGNIRLTICVNFFFLKKSFFLKE